jgi:hypothetical protein
MGFKASKQLSNNQDHRPVPNKMLAHHSGQRSYSYSCQIHLCLTRTTGVVDVVYVNIVT